MADGTATAVIPAQVKQVIEELSFFAVEDLRTARRFIKSVLKEKDIDATRFEALDKRSTEQDMMSLLMELINGESIGVISEAGCPGIADPGALLVELCHQNSIKVVPLVGPSSIFMALMASGMNGQGFTFHGYLPIEKRDRAQKIKELDRLAKQTEHAQLFMETPYRNDKLLDDVIKNCAPNTLLCIATNITGEEEQIKTKSVADWKKNKPNINKKPTIFVIGR